jgi:hypothetical protein
MESCEELRSKIHELAVLQATALPASARNHLEECPACTRALAAARLARGLLAVAGEEPEPPADFVERVLGTLPPERAVWGTDADLWRLGWKLVPAFAATVVAFLIFFQASGVPGPVGLVSAEGLSASERLVLEAPSPEPDLVLAAVMEGDGR